jgi:hypothetical protein
MLRRVPEIEAARHIGGKRRRFYVWVCPHTHGARFIATYVRNVDRLTGVAIGPVGDLYLVNGPGAIRVDHDTLKTQTVVDPYPSTVARALSQRWWSVTSMERVRRAFSRLQSASPTLSPRRLADATICSVPILA